MRRTLRRLALELLKPELDAAEAKLAAAEAKLAAAESAAQAVEHLAERAAGIEAALNDLRAAYLATRAEFEQVRDGRVPSVEGELQRLHGAVETLQGEVGRRLDALETLGLPGLQKEMETLRDVRLPSVESAQRRGHAAVETIQRELVEVRDVRLERVEVTVRELQESTLASQASLAEVRDTRVATLEAALADQQTAVESAQAQLERLDVERLGHAEADLARLQDAIDAVQRLAEEVRDGRLPALAGRVDALVSRLYEDLTATGGLVDRLIAGEPLRVAVDTMVEASIPDAVREASKQFLADFRGSEQEIAARVQEYVPLLAANAPVLDLGCGRGELLAALRDAGVDGRGVDTDPAMVDACRRSSLIVARDEALHALRECADASLGGVTAIHVLEHLHAATWMSIIEAAARALRPGGVLIVECPDPESLRVGSDLFWSDPTHVRPIHPAAVVFVMRAVGLTVEQVLHRRPFPPEQSLRREGQSAEVAELAGRLDEWLSGARDFVVVARRRAEGAD